MLLLMSCKCHSRIGDMQGKVTYLQFKFNLFIPIYLTSLQLKEVLGILQLENLLDISIFKPTLAGGNYQSQNFSGIIKYII